MNKYKDNYPQFDVWGDAGDFLCRGGAVQNSQGSMGQSGQGGTNQSGQVGMGQGGMNQSGQGSTNQSGQGGTNQSGQNGMGQGSTNQNGQGSNINGQQNAVDENGCICGAVLATTYTKIQQFRDLYEPSEGLMRGTIYKELDKPFLGGKERRR